MHKEWDRNDIFAKFISSSHPTLPVVGIQFLCVGPRQLALPVEIGYQFLSVGTPTCTLLADFSSASMLAPLL